MTSVADAVACAQAGADLLGLVADDRPMVPEAVEFSRAREIFDAVAGKVTTVAMTLRTDSDEIVAMAEAVRPDILHIAGNLQPEDCAAIREELAPMKLMRTIAARGGEALIVASLYEHAADLIVLDSASAGVAGFGAAGRPRDWGISRRVIEHARIPVILGGALGAENVASAIAETRPWGVDTFTRTDVDGRRGVKDLSRVREFVAAARGVKRSG